MNDNTNITEIKIQSKINMEYPHKTGKIDIFGDEIWVFTPEAENDPYYSITFDSIEEFEEWKKGASFSNGGGILTSAEKMSKLGIENYYEFGKKHRQWIFKALDDNIGGEYVGYQLTVNDDKIIIIGNKGTVEFKINSYDNFPNGVVAINTKSIYHKQGGTVGKKTFIKRVKQMHNNIDEVILKDGTHIKGKDLMENGGGVADLSFEKRSLAKPKESILMSKLYNGEIPSHQLELIIGRKPNYPNEYVGSIKLEKCFMRNFYRLIIV